VVFASSLLLTTGCQSDQDKAQETLAGYTLAEMIGSKESVLPYVAAADREVIEAKLKDKKDSGFDTEAMEKIARDKLGDKFAVKITDSKIDGDKMSVTADVTTPDEDKLKAALFGKIMKVAKENKEASDEEKNEALKSALIELFDEEEFETVTNSETFELRKEEDKWLVFVDLKTQQEIKDIVSAGKDHSIKGELDKAQAKLAEAKEKLGDRSFEDAEKKIKNLEVSILYDGARKLERDDNYAEAIANYKKIVAINPDWEFPPIKTEEAEEKIAELEAELKKQKAQDAYREKITLNGVEVKDLYGSKRIMGEIKNDGDKVIDKVELAIKFFDKDDKEIHSDSSSPVFAYGNEAKAFKPGHSKKFTKYATKAPDAWDDKIEVTVSKVEFFEKK
jgi:tetratricopeptide (TPR) repeat protein